MTKGRTSTKKVNLSGEKVKCAYCNQELSKKNVKRHVKDLHPGKKIEVEFDIV